MTYKIIAIAVLALLALSSVMNPKAFRLLTGALAVAVVTLVTGYLVLAKYAPTPEKANDNAVARLLAKLSGFVHAQPNGDDAAQSASQRILDGFEGDLIEIDPIDDRLAENDPTPKQDRPRRDRIIVIERHPVEKTEVEREDQQEKVRAKILAIVDQYLKEFKKRNTSAEVARVQAEDLYLPLLKFQKTQGADGKWEYTAVFDEAFNKHVVIRARQLTVRDRLLATTYACIAVGVVLLLLFGSLKVINSRKRLRPEKDLLRLTGSPVA